MWKANQKKKRRNNHCAISITNGMFDLPFFGVYIVFI